MPRPRRSRPAPAQAADTASAETEAVPERGRTRTSGHAVEKETQEAPRRTTRRGRKQSVEVEPRRDAAEQDALRKASDARDDAMKRLALEDVLTTSDAATSEANKIDLSVEMGRKVQETPAQQHQRRDTTGLELDDEMFAGLDDSLDLGDDTDLTAPPSGQRSTDTSSMTTGFFKRRGRAPSVSLYGNDSAAIRPSSRAGGTPAISSSFNIGAFKRRQREPSILGTARKPLRPESPGEGAGAASDDEDVFAPEAESTPLNRRKTREVEVDVEVDIYVEVEAEVEAPPSTRSREGKGVDVPEAEVEAEAPSSTRSRKRRSIEVPEGSDRPEKVSRLEASDLEAGAEADLEVEEEAEPELEPETEAQAAAGIETQAEVEAQPEPAFEEDLGSDLDIPADVASLHSDDLMPDDPANDSDSSDLSSLPSLPSPQLPSTRVPARPMTPINLSEVMAPPQSSGSEEDDIWPDLRAAVKRKRHGPVTPLRDGNISDMSSPPSLTHSPNLPAARHTTQRKQKGKPSPKLTTASLTGLLPRRRHRTRTTDDGSSDAEVDGSGLANDEDELSYIDTRSSKRRGKTTPLARRTATNRPGSRGGKAVIKTSPIVSRTVKRTYSRRSSDKENPSDDEDSTGLSPAPDDTFDAAAEEEDSESVAEELKNAVKKFAEVDQWEMEFEEITQSSSPSGAR